MLVHSAMSPWQSDAIGLRKYDLGLSSHLISRRQLQQQQSGNFPIHLIRKQELIFSITNTKKFTPDTKTSSKVYRLLSEKQQIDDMY
jgi:hypothetical protein